MTERASRANGKLAEAEFSVCRESPVSAGVDCGSLLPLWCRQPAAKAEALMFVRIKTVAHSRL